MSLSVRQSLAYFGAERGQETLAHLRAGPLDLDFSDGVFRHIRLGGHEVLRAVYFAVRDRDWNTIPGVISNLAIESISNRFTLSFDCANREKDIDFRWNAKVKGNDDGRIAWRMAGKAFSSFEKSRIGICVLHPIQECAGQPCCITHGNGAEEEARFPATVAPWQPFLDVKAITYRLAEGLDAEIVFYREVFETEDQRNWTDASFKTYSTPLSLPHPVQIGRGEAVDQRVILSLYGAIPVDVPNPSIEGEVRLTVRRGCLTRMPGIGVKDATGTYALSKAEALRLSSLGLDWLGVDLCAGDKGSEEAFWQASCRAAALDLPLEIALEGELQTEELRRVEEEITARGVKVSRWLAEGRALHAAGSSVLAKLCAMAPVALGSGTNFAELNRNRPELLTEGGLWFSVNPQMHAWDDTTLIENLAGQSAVMSSIRSWAGAAKVTVSPVTLKPRGKRRYGAVVPDGEIGAVPGDADCRQMSLLGAGWTLGSLKRLAEGGAANVTYYETVGWRGVLAAGSNAGLGQPGLSEGGVVYPMFHVFADVAAFKGAEVIHTESSAPLRAEGFAVRASGRLRVMVANFSVETIKIKLEMGGSASQAELRTLDEENVEWAMRDPELYRQQRAQVICVEGGVVCFELKPFGLATIDSLESLGTTRDEAMLAGSGR